MGRNKTKDDTRQRRGDKRQGRVSEIAYGEIVQRLRALQHLKLKALVPALIPELARWTSLALTPTQRYELLHLRMEPAIEQIAGKLPKPPPDQALAEASIAALTLEQRLYQLVIDNLKVLLRDLDRSEHFAVPNWREMHHWTQSYLMGILGRQITYGISTGRDVPQGTWQALHDLFLYLVSREGLSPQRREGVTPQVDRAFYLEVAYKRWLMTGLHAAAPRLPAIDQSRLEEISAWALEARLVEPAAMLGRQRLILVEVARDGPPRYEGSILSEPFVGWVLRPPKPFRDLIVSAYRPRVVPDGAAFDELS